MAGVRTQGNTPVRKVSFGALSAAIAGLLLWILNTYVPYFSGDHKITAEAAGFITTIVSFFTGYLVAPGENERNIAT